MVARAGHAVTMVGGPQHVGGVRREGLFLETPSFKEHVPMGASTDASGARNAELVLFCVKSTDTESAAKALAPHLERDALVLSLQNGVDNIERLRAVLQQEIAPAAGYVATEMARPGHVRHTRPGELVIGAATRDIAAAFTAAGVPGQISDNVMGALLVN